VSARLPARHSGVAAEVPFEVDVALVDVDGEAVEDAVEALWAVLGATVTVLVVVLLEPHELSARIAKAATAVVAIVLETRRMLMGILVLWPQWHQILPAGNPRASICGVTEDRAKLPAAAEWHLRLGEEGLKSLLEQLDPIWGPLLIVAGAILLDVSLPDKVAIGPSWLLPSLEAALLIGLMIASPHPKLRHSPLRRRIVLALIGLVSLTNIVSLVLLCHYLLHHNQRIDQGRPLILAGIVLWVTNVLLFGLWYWELDRGGPVERALNAEAKPDFLFPQMTLPEFAPQGWMPGLIDYLYVSFTNATAFSPTDTMPLSRMTKVLMSTQALTALLTIGLVVARAVNILQ
jgi:hypothetical protein